MDESLDREIYEAQKICLLNIPWNIAIFDSHRLAFHGFRKFGESTATDDPNEWKCHTFVMEKIPKIVGRLAIGNEAFVHDHDLLFCSGTSKEFMSYRRL